MQTWSNLADTLIQLAQAHSAQRQHAEARAAVAAARAAYVSSTAISSSDVGDDLPGLLCNWGTGLTAAGGMLREAGDTAGALEALRDAVRRLECCADLHPSDIQVQLPHVPGGRTTPLEPWWTSAARFLRIWHVNLAFVCNGFA